MDDSTGQSRLRDADMIRSIEGAYDRAWSEADIESLMSLFAPQASIVDPYGGVSTGRDEIRRLLAELLSGPGRASTHTSTIFAVTFVTDDVALADGEALIEGVKGRGGKPVPSIRHRFTDVFLLTDESWRIAQIRAYVYLEGPRP